MTVVRRRRRLCCYVSRGRDDAFSSLAKESSFSFFDERWKDDDE